MNHTRSEHVEIAREFIKSPTDVAGLAMARAYMIGVNLIEQALRTQPTESHEQTQRTTTDRS